MEIKILQKSDLSRVRKFSNLVFEGEEECIERVIVNPFNGVQRFAYIEEDGEIAATTGLMIRNQRLGNKTIKVGEIGIVGTLPKYRNKGYASHLMNYWIDYMKENNISMSFLFGIPKFYEQFGYHYATPAHFYDYTTIDIRLLKNVEGEYEVRELSREIIKDSIAEINNVYCECNRHNNCTEVRSEEYWEYKISRTNEGNHKWYVITHNNHIKGYFWLTIEEGELIIREVGVINNNASDTIVDYVKNQCKDNELDNVIGIKGPQSNPFIKYLFSKGAKIQCDNIIFPGNWAGMYKIVNLKEIMNTLKETFEKRIQDSRFYNFTGTLRIKSNEEEVAIAFNNGRVSIVDCKGESTENIMKWLENEKIVKDNVKLNLRECRSTNNRISYTDVALEVNIPMNIITPLVTGYRNIEFYKGELNIQNEEIYKLLGIMFPKGNPFVWDLEFSEEVEQ